MPPRCAQGRWGWVPTYVNTTSYDPFCWLSLSFFWRPCLSGCLAAMVEMLHRYPPIWVGTGVLRDTALVPYAAYQPCRAQGIWHHSLLGLLLEVGAGCHLKASARKNIEMEVASYSQAGSHFSHSTLGCLTWVTHCRSQLSCAPVPLHYTMRCAVQSSSIQGIYWDLNTVCDAFDKSLQHDALDESPMEPLMDALQLIPNVTCIGMGTY